MSDSSKLNYLTQEGYDKLKAELEHLKTKERPAISQQIAEARDKGDLSENAEYDAAKNAQGLLEMKISKLETLVSNSRVIDTTNIDTSKVALLTKVQIKNTKNNALMTYTLVSENEADIKKGKIAISTPIAKALLGKKVGEVVEVKVPAGVMTFEIIDISL